MYPWFINLLLAHRSVRDLMGGGGRGGQDIAQISRHYNEHISSYHWIKWLNFTTGGRWKEGEHSKELIL